MHPSRTARRVAKIVVAAKSPAKILKFVRAAVNYAGEPVLEAQPEAQPETLSNGFGVLPVVPLQEILNGNPSVRIEKFSCRDGNVSPAELLAIAAIVAQRKPQVMLEIGTFDGNTTLQIAANAPESATIFTIDLPEGVDSTEKAIEEADHRYVLNEHKRVRRYVGSGFDQQIRQLYGDTATFDFGCVAKAGKPEFVFIDGSHSYDYVKNDTEKMLKILAPNGVILWHDYHPYWTGVCRYLAELSSQMKIINIEDTKLAYFAAGPSHQ